MALENLKSIFKDNVDTGIDNFKQTTPSFADNSSNLKNNFDTPILDSITRPGQTLNNKTPNAQATDNPLLTFKNAGANNDNFTPLHAAGIQFYNGENHENNLNNAKLECKEIGFKEGTEAFGECVLDLTE